MEMGVDELLQCRRGRPLESSRCCWSGWTSSPRCESLLLVVEVLEAVVDVAAAEASMGVLSTRWRVERVVMRTLSCTHDGDRVESRF